MRLPEEYTNVMITYRGEVRDSNGSVKKEIVTRRSFYSKSTGFYNSNDEWINTPEGFFDVPKYWKEWMQKDGSTSLLPHTFHHHPRVFPKDIIKWEAIPLQ
tara:strand:- start:323 stop:625 length:303 start_codon:yes stop_codon:yes gene_type:complete